MVQARFGTDGVRGVANAELTPELVLALGRAIGPHHHRHHLPGRAGHPALRPHAPGGAVGRAGRRGRRRGRRRRPAHPGPGLAVGPPGLPPPWSSRPPTTPSPTTASSCSRRGAKLSAEVGGGHRGRARAASSTRRQGSPPLEGHGVGRLITEPDPGAAYVDHLVGSLEGRTARRHAAGGGQRQRGRLRPGRRGVRAPGRRSGGHRLRARRHQHQRRLRIDRHRDPGRAPWSSTAPTWAWPSTATPTGCWPSTTRGSVVDGDELLALFALDLADRGQLAGNTVVVTVMTNLGLPPGHGGAGHRGQGDAGRGPPRAGRPGRGRPRPRRRAVRAHHLPPAGHHRRRPADRAGPGRPGGPDRDSRWPSCSTA